MCIPKTDGKMEGWLYTIRLNRFGNLYSRKRYFILQDKCLNSFKTIPSFQNQKPDKSAVIDSCIQVTDNGRQSINKEVFFIFSLYNTLDQAEELKLGASSSEEAERWMRSIQDAALKECPSPGKNFVACSKRKWPSFRLGGSKRKHSVDWTLGPSMDTDEITSNGIEPSPWKIIGCQNGLRFFKEAKDLDSHGRASQHWDDHPAIMAVGVVNGTSEAVFQTLTSLGPSRSEWDLCFYKGVVVENLDSHTDIFHMQLYSDWLPWGMKRRDFLLRRYWRKDDDGTYVILFHSVFHKKCPPQRGYVRASLKSGGFVITPVNQGKHSLIKHMLAVDWKFWKLQLRPSSARAITIRMLERVAALRELFRAKAENYSSDYSSGDLTRDIGLPQSEKEDIKTEVQDFKEVEEIKENNLLEDEVKKPYSGYTSSTGPNDTADEFFDVPESTDYDELENGWSSEYSPEQDSQSQDTYPAELQSASVFVNKLHNLAAQKKDHMDIEYVAREDNMSYFYGAALQKDPSRALICSWAAADPSTFFIRGENYLHDRRKIKAKSTLMHMVGADWLSSIKREDDLGGRHDSIVQKYAQRGGAEFFFIVNMQVPGTTAYTLALYYMMETPLQDHPVLHRFVDGDDAYRNSRFKLIPHISEGSWIVKQSVGKKACLVGQALNINYFRGKNYLEVQVDVGSSTVAKSVVSLVLGYLNNLVIEMAFLIEANTQEELPEILVGTCRLNHLDVSKSRLIP